VLSAHGAGVFELAHGCFTNISYPPGGGNAVFRGTLILIQPSNYNHLTKKA